MHDLLCVFFFFYSDAVILIIEALSVMNQPVEVRSLMATK